MLRHSDSPRSLVLQAIPLVVLPLLVAAWVVVTWLQRPQTGNETFTIDGTSGIPEHKDGVDLPPSPALWNRRLWRPLTDPPPPPKQELPPRVQLLAIRKLDERWLAMLNLNDGMGVVTLGAGESKRGCQVIAVTAKEVEVMDQGKTVKLALSP